MFKNRVVVPADLRPSILQSLHSGHQGVSSMVERMDKTVFWPGIHEDIREVRRTCGPCNRIAPSQPNPPSTPLRHPDYPFQLICADYFQYKGVQYLVIVDRYSNWPSVMKVKGSGTAEQLVEAIKSHCEVFGIPEELSSDGDSQFTASKTVQFLRDWGIQHRISSAAHPHNNCRAELGVKGIKRMLIGNVAPDGSLNTDEFRRALMQYRNTPDRDTKQSPAQIIFGRDIRDFLPCAHENYKLAGVWNRTAAYREAALMKRHSQARERLDEHTKRLDPLEVGDSVYIQNQIGKSPLKWDKSGIVIESNGFDQYIIRTDGSGRLTRRNRKFLRKFTPYTPAKIGPTSRNENRSSTALGNEGLCSAPENTGHPDHVITDANPYNVDGGNSGAPSPTNSGAPSPRNFGASSPGNSGAPSPVNSDVPSPASSDVPSPTNSGAPSPTNSGAASQTDFDASSARSSDEPLEPRRSGRIRRPNPKYRDYVIYNSQIYQCG